MIEHIHIISESRSGSSALFTQYMNELELDKSYSWLSECFDLDKHDNINETIDFITNSDRKLVIKNHLHQIREHSTVDQNRILSLTDNTVCIMRRNKLDQCLSLALARQSRNWSGHSDKIEISNTIWERAVEDIHSRFADILEFSSKCKKTIWYEDFEFNSAKKKNKPKSDVISNLNELIQNYYTK